MVTCIDYTTLKRNVKTRRNKMIYCININVKKDVLLIRKYYIVDKYIVLVNCVLLLAENSVNSYETIDSAVFTAHRREAF